MQQKKSFFISQYTFDLQLNGNEKPAKRTIHSASFYLEKKPNTFDFFIYKKVVCIQTENMVLNEKNKMQRIAKKIQKGKRC